MTKDKRDLRGYLLLAAVSASSCSLAAMAQASEEADSGIIEEYPAMEEITVTASRRSQNIQDVPAAVAAVDPETFTKSGLTSINDLLSYTPGYFATSGSTGGAGAGQRGRGSIGARGVAQQGSTAVTAVYVDDVPMTSNSGFSDGGALFFDGLLGDIERVEMIKGPQGTLFGATAISGAVRYISREPTLHSQRASLTADLSTTADGELNEMYRGFYSVPLVEDKLGLTVSGFSAKDGGYVDQVDAASGEVIQENANDGDDYGYSADLYFEPSDRLNLRLKGLKQETSFGMGSAVNIASLKGRETYGELTSNAAFGENEAGHQVLSGSLNYEFDGATLNITSSRVEYDLSLVQDYLQYASAMELVYGLAPGTLTEATFTTAKSSEKNVHEMRLTSTGEGKIEWITGLYHADESTDNFQHLVGRPGEYLGLYADFPSEYKELAAFGNLTYYITPDFDLTAGMRYAQTELGLTTSIDGVLALPGFTEYEPAEANIQTYLFTARYRPGENTSLYTRVASGYRPATASIPLMHPLTGEQLTETKIDQDDLWSYEFGAKGESADGLFSYDTALWYLDWKNFQTTVTYFGANSQDNANDGVEAYGFEGSFTVQPTADFNVVTAIAYTNSTLSGDEPGIFGSAGDPIPRVPEWTFSSMARYDYDLSSEMYGWLTGGFRYVDSAPSAFENGDPLNPATNMESDAHFLVDVSAGIEWRDTVFNLYVNNLFNERAYSAYFAQDIPGTDILNITGVPVKPRTIGLSATYSFE
ncbi:TonB-dependent receptor [Microbulbifer taiwanensis]|uniref:TonB-dependent receptor n=1 Tax=Microbulbifer taiwanensis TaxID=986746 RepID=A0ABW1YGW0_9GAMM|nr:TonB-dependent receptor plug domain-containing protein [Microbulbifer taiwanensis]